MEFWSRLLQTNLIIGIIVAIIGLGMILLAKRIVKTYKKVDTVEKTDKVVMALRVFGLLFLLIAMFIMILY